MGGAVMSGDLQNLLRKAAELGFTRRPELDGGGHIILEHTNGQTYRCPSTPSEYRSLRNTLAALEWIAGQKLDRPNHRKSRKNHAAEDTAEVEASRKRHAPAFDAELQRREQARLAAIADRRRREIEELMRP